MPIASGFNSSAGDAQTQRRIFGKKIGEIITEVYGDERLQKLFEEKGGVPENLKELPSGDIAVRMGVISPAVKNALLIAQAAERAAQAAEKAVRITPQITALAKALHEAGLQIDTQAAGFVSHTDAAFKFVGSDRDPADLKKAQATWMLAQMYLNNEIQVLGGYASAPAYVGNGYSVDIDYGAGVYLAAAALYDEAASLLQAEDDSAVASLAGIGAAMRADVSQPEKARTPADLAYILEWGDGKSGQDLMIALSDERYMEPTELAGVYKKLGALIKGETPAAPPAPAPAPAP